MIQTPIIEDSEVFKKTLGMTSDIIKKETYTFKDRSENEITLRPEGTAPVVRFFINNKWICVKKTLWRYYGNDIIKFF